MEKIKIIGLTERKYTNKYIAGLRRTEEEECTEYTLHGLSDNKKIFLIMRNKKDFYDDFTVRPESILKIEYDFSGKMTHIIKKEVEIDFDFDEKTKEIENEVFYYSAFKLEDSTPCENEIRINMDLFEEL